MAPRQFLARSDIRLIDFVAGTEVLTLPQDIDEQTGEPVEKHDWVPPKSWTAWPLRADLVPNDAFMKRTEDEDDILTYRRQESGMPSSNLEEVLSATVLKFAKKNFRKRYFPRKQKTTAPSSENEPAVKGEDVSSGNESWRGDAHPSEEGSDKEKKSPTRPQKAKRSFSPMVSTNDDLSYELIRPSSRVILEKLDRTLSILHNARVAAVDNGAETSASEDDEVVTPSRGRRRSSSHGMRRRSMSIAPETEHKTDSDGRKRNKKGAGRPRKKNPQPKEGETHREFLVRIARENHKRIPTFSDEDPDAPATSGKARRESKGPERARSRSRSRSRRRSQTPSKDNGDLFKMEHISQWKLRDWRDVIGAASLAGFSPTVLARATERCVDLFREGTVLHTLNQTEPGVESSVITTHFEPGTADVASPSPSDEDDVAIRQARAMSRQPSVALSGSSSSDPKDEVKLEKRDDGAKRRQRARSRSITPSAARFYCTHAGCKRAVQGFRRRNNLVRHMRLVHGESLGDHLEGFERPDELYGGVHVDGFLKPITPRQGWRYEDLRKRSRSRKRSRDARGDPDISRNSLV